MKYEKYGSFTIGIGKLKSLTNEDLSSSEITTLEKFKNDDIF